MREIIIFGSEVRSRLDIHECISEALNFPSWYGNNLDALYDCLSEISYYVLIRIVGKDIIDQRLDGYGTRLITVLTAVSMEKPNIEFIVE